MESANSGVFPWTWGISPCFLCRIGRSSIMFESWKVWLILSDGWTDICISMVFNVTSLLKSSNNFSLIWKQNPVNSGFYLELCGSSWAGPCLPFLPCLHLVRSSFSTLNGLSSFSLQAPCWTSWSFFYMSLSSTLWLLFAWLWLKLDLPGEVFFGKPNSTITYPIALFHFLQAAFIWTDIIDYCLSIDMWALWEYGLLLYFIALFSESIASSMKSGLKGTC